MTEAEARDAQQQALRRMPIVRELVERLQRDNFRFGPAVQIFGTQHLMAQSLTFCWALHALGLSYRQIALTGKVYSTNPETHAALQALGIQVARARRYRLSAAQAAEQVHDLKVLASAVTRRVQGHPGALLLVVDDGGHALTNARGWFPSRFKIAGVEQTASGFRQPGIGSISFPTVDVAASAIKRHCEPAIVIDAVLKRAATMLNRWSGGSVGIVGLGYIGMALYERLTSQGIAVRLYDERTNSYPALAPGQRARSAFEVLNDCHLIFGCTGVDITRGFPELVKARGLTRQRRCLVSLSSGDDEFFTLKRLLLRGKASSTYDWEDIPDVQASCWGSEFVIPRNGFPINFDNGPESAPLEHIQGTIAALIGALCQAARLAKHTEFGGRTKLDYSFQEWLFDQWIEYLPHQNVLGARFPRTLIEKLSEPRAEPRSTVQASPFGYWTAERRQR